MEKTSTQEAVQINVPASLVAQIDKQLDQGVSNFRSRDHLIEHAVKLYLDNLRRNSKDAPCLVEPRHSLEAQPLDEANHSDDPDHLHRHHGTDKPRRSNDTGYSSRPNELHKPNCPDGAGMPLAPRLPINVREFTRLDRPANVNPVAAGIARVPDQALSGLHNRDYPSLWAASQLVTLCSAQNNGEPIRWDIAAKAITKLAWNLADVLKDQRAKDGSKLTALFPSNRTKTQSAEAAFRDFAMGKISDRGTVVLATGPWFSWRIAQVVIRDDIFCVGPTLEGIELLGALNGISLDIPHSEEHAKLFFTYLSRNSGADWRALMEVLRLASANPSRNVVNEAFLRAQPHWSDAQVSTNVSGYIARCREWGLLAPKLSAGRYSLTDIGRELLADAMRAVTNRH